MNLSDLMRERLDKWRKTSKENSNVNEKWKKPKNYVARRDYGDDFHDHELKQQKIWNEEVKSNPIYQTKR